MMRLQNLGYPIGGTEPPVNPMDPFAAYNNMFATPNVIQPGQEAFDLPMTSTPQPYFQTPPPLPYEPIPFNFFNRGDRLSRRAQRNTEMLPMEDMPYEPSEFNFFNRADRMARRAYPEESMFSQDMAISQEGVPITTSTTPMYTSIDQLVQAYKENAGGNIETYYYKEFDRLSEIESIDKDFKSGKMTQEERDAKVDEINKKYKDTMPTIPVEGEQTTTGETPMNQEDYKKYLLDMMLYSRAGLGIPETAFLTGQYLGMEPGTKGKWLGAGLGIADLALKGAREVLSGIGYQRANNQAKQWYAEQLAKKRFEPISQTRTGYTGDIATAAEGGTFNNPGFNALPLDVQNKIMQGHQNKKYAEGGGPGDRLKEFGERLKENAFFSAYPYEYNAFDTINTRNDTFAIENWNEGNPSPNYQDAYYTPNNKFGLGYEKYLKFRPNLGIRPSIGINVGLPYSGDFKPSLEGFYSTKYTARRGENSGIPKIKSTLTAGYSPEEGINASLDANPYWDLFKNRVGRDTLGIPFQKGYNTQFLRGYAGPSFEFATSMKEIGDPAYSGGKRFFAAPSFNYGAKAGFSAKPFKKSDLQLKGDFSLYWNPVGGKGREGEESGKIQGSWNPSAKIGLVYPLTNLPRFPKSDMRYQGIIRDKNYDDTQEIENMQREENRRQERMQNIEPMGESRHPRWLEDGGRFNNPGFNALPLTVQNKIIQGTKKYEDGGLGYDNPLVADANSYLDLFSFLSQGQMPLDYGMGMPTDMNANAPMDYGMPSDMSMDMGSTDFATDPALQPGQYVEFEYGGKMHKGIIKSNNGKTISLK